MALSDFDVALFDAGMKQCHGWLTHDKAGKADDVDKADKDELLTLLDHREAPPVPQEARQPPAFPFMAYPFCCCKFPWQVCMYCHSSSPALQADEEELARAAHSKAWQTFLHKKRQYEERLQEEIEEKKLKSLSRKIARTTAISVDDVPPWAGVNCIKVDGHTKGSQDKEEIGGHPQDLQVKEELSDDALEHILD